MSLLKSFEDIQKNFKYKPKSFTIDNVIFQLHYKGTLLIYLVSTLLVTSQQYIGEHIRCIGDSNLSDDPSIPPNVLNSFCFFTSTFTVIRHFDPELVDEGVVAHPGVGPYETGSKEPIRKYAYYQWVAYILFFQAISFYGTHWLWKTLEGEKMKFFSHMLRDAVLSYLDKDVTLKNRKILSKKNRDKCNKEIANVLRNQSKAKIHFWWSISLYICEILNVIHVIFQFYITNLLLEGQFIYLGYNITKEGLDSSVDILDEVFPKVTKCTFNKYGPSGEIQSHDAMCVMALNIINEKIYTFLWFWLIFLLLVSSVNILWRSLTCVLYSVSAEFRKLAFRMICTVKISSNKSLKINNFGFTDWLFLRYLSKNTEQFVFGDILELLVDNETNEKKEEENANLMKKETDE